MPSTAIVNVTPTRRLFTLGKRLNPQQVAFIDEYLIDLDAHRAGAVVGWSKGRATRQLKNPHVMEAVRLAMEQRSRRLHVSQDWIVQELAKIAGANMGDYLGRDENGRRLKTVDISTLTDDQMAAVKTLDWEKGKIELHDKHAALVSLARHLGMFVDRSEITHSLEVRVANMTREERLARIRELVEPMREYLHELELEKTEYAEVPDKSARKVP